MAAISLTCMSSVVGKSSRFSSLQLPHRSKNVRGQSSSSLPERVSSGKNCSPSGISSSYGRSRVPVAAKDGRAGYTSVSNFVGSINCATRCSSLPGDGSTGGNSTSSNTLRWVEEDVEIGNGEGGARKVSVVRTLPEDAESISLESFEEQDVSDLLEMDRPQPIPASFASSNQMALDAAVNALGGSNSDVQLIVPYQPKILWFANSEEEETRFLGKAINAILAGGAISYALTKAVTVDHDYWHGWTTFEVLKYAPLHNWHAYEEVLKSNPVLAKMMISGVVYSIGDWIGQVCRFCFNYSRCR